MSRAARRMSAMRRQRGLTLVEMMVAMVLGLLVTGGIIQIFIGNRTTYAFNEGLSRLQENGRFALDTLSYRIRQSGQIGCLWGVPVTNNLNGPNGFAIDFENGLAGYEAAGTGVGATYAAAATNPTNSGSVTNWAPNLPAELANSVVPGSDVIVVRNGNSTGHALATPFASADSVFATAAAGEYQVGDIAIVSDCQKASVFQITGVTDSGGGLQLDHTAAGTPGNATDSWSSPQEYSIGAQVRRAETWVYYVGAPVGGGAPALFQRRLVVDSGATTATLAPEELVDSVETMQVLYGIDNGLDGAVDQYATGNAVTDWGEVVTVRVALVMRSPVEYGTEVDNRTYPVNEMTFDPVDDRRERQVFTTTIALRNRLP